MLFWKKNRAIDALALEVADEIYSQLPPEMLAASAKDAKKKLGKVQARAADRLREFIHVHDLGVYGKARVNLKVMERLQEHGYKEEFIAGIKEYLLLNAS